MSGRAKKAYLRLAAGFGAGLSPFAPGTAGTLVAMPFAWALSWLPVRIHLAVLALCLPLAAFVCGRAAQEGGEEDPSWVVLDEIVGYWIAVAFVPSRFPAYLAGFLLFRVFDILKPPPAGWVDRNMPGGWGILLDDVLAGLYTRLSLSILVWAGAL